MNIGRNVSRMSVVSACVSALALSGCLMDADSAAFEEDMSEVDQAIEPECAGACDLTMEEVELLSRGSTEEIGTENYESCTDPAVSLAQPDGAAVNLQYPNCGYADVSATSIDGTYDQPLCPHKFVTEVRQVNNRAFQPFVEAIPASTITTESACEGNCHHGPCLGLQRQLVGVAGQPRYHGHLAPGVLRRPVLLSCVLPAPVFAPQREQRFQQGARGRLRGGARHLQGARRGRRLRRPGPLLVTGPAT